MAKLQDKFFNRVIEGDLELEPSEIEAGASNGIKVFEDIKDKDGHARFIEGNNAPAQTLPEGFEITYSKWSLSGTHLLVVCAGNVANGTTITGLQFSLTQNLPEWISDKIVAVIGSVIEYKTVPFYNSNYSSDIITVAVVKDGGGGVRFQIAQTKTISDDRTFRVQFDLLIDNE